MPRIRLKDRSPEFEGSQSSFSKTHQCEHFGCSNNAEYKAPKHRGLNEHYHFCLEHVQDYNRSWNFFDGMSDDEVLAHINRDRYGDRPTWKYATYAEAEEYIRQRSWDHFRAHDDFADGGASQHEERRQSSNNNGSPESTELKAMAIMGLNPPITFPEIKKTYRHLVKKFHPDLNHGCKKAEDRLKEINMAYTVLKGAYEKYDKLMKKRS